MIRARRIGAKARMLAALVLFAFALPGCMVVDWSRVAELLSPKKKKKRAADDEDDSDAPRVDLGSARYPDKAAAPKSELLFSAPTLEPARYQLTYVLADASAKDLEAQYQTYARSVGFSAGTEHRFRWFPPPGCQSDMGCVFQALSEEDRAAVLPLVDLFKKRQKEGHLDNLKLAKLVVGFVQDIRYREPEEEPFGVLAPALVVSRRQGDCDSKSLLAHIVLNELGYDTVMLSSDAHRHAMLGIALPLPGTKIRYEGRDYAYTELTAHGAPIGYLFPQNSNPNDWRVVPLRRPLSSHP